MTPQRSRESSSETSVAAWHDSDDERITVSLQSNPRLRKLRNYESEDLINGREYTKRLRRQYERLHPTPDWALQAKSKETSHKYKNSSFDASRNPVQEPSSEDEMSVDSDEISAMPLVKLLQQTDTLIQSERDFQGSKRRIRPEVIDMQRTKDVGVAQPVSNDSEFYSFAGSLTILIPVCHYVSRLPSCSSPSSLFRPIFYNLATSHLAPSSKPEPTSDISPH